MDLSFRQKSREEFEGNAAQRQRAKPRLACDRIGDSRFSSALLS
jgi:hypothetical protein